MEVITGLRVKLNFKLMADIGSRELVIRLREDTGRTGMLITITTSSF